MSLKRRLSERRAEGQGGLDCRDHFSLNFWFVGGSGKTAFRDRAAEAVEQVSGARRSAKSDMSGVENV